jgi:arylsulfatase A-like enzyme
LTLFLWIINSTFKIEISPKTIYKSYISLPLFFLIFIEALYINSSFYHNIAITHSKRIYGGIISLAIALSISIGIYYIALKLRRRKVDKKKLNKSINAIAFIPLIVIFLLALISLMLIICLGKSGNTVIIQSKPSERIPYSKKGEEKYSANPNILFISVDTLRADHLGCYGNKKIKTPNIDFLARQGARFSNAYTTVPITLPSHASMMTALHPLNIGCISNRWIIKEEILTLPEILQKEGYVTAGFISGYPLYSPFGFDQGFCYYDEQLREYEYPFKKLKRCLLVRIIEGMRITADLSGTRRAKATTDAAITWLQHNKEKPFFLFIHYWDPHKPLFAPRKYNQKKYHPHTSWLERMSRFIPIFYKYAYDSEIAYVDDQVGRIFSAIKSHNLMTKTIIVFTADHGEGLGDHDYNDHTARLYQEQIHVPLIITYQNHINAGKTVLSLVRLIDIMPTLLELLNAPAAKNIDGVSLTDKIFNKEEQDNIILEGCANSHGEAPFYNLWAIIKNNWKLIYHVDKKGKVELYNLKQDSLELANLEKNMPLKNHELKKLLIEWHNQWKNKPIKRKMIEYEDAIEKLKSLGYLQ